MNENNRKWYTIFIKPQFSDEGWEILGQIKGSGTTNLVINSLRPFYGDKLRSLEGKVNVITDKLKAMYF